MQIAIPLRVVNINERGRAMGSVALGIGASPIGVIAVGYLADEIGAQNALGLSSFSCFIKILAPQIIRYSIPGLGNVWQITLKDTALISVTGLIEIMRQASVAARSTHSPYTFYLAAAILMTY